MNVSLPIEAADMAVGLCLGSYVTTAALRWSKGRQSTFGRSSCDHCGVELSFVKTTPLLSYVVQGGACTGCGGRIDRIHILGELAGPTILGIAFISAPPLQAVALSILGLLLLAAAVVDAKIGRLPDVLTLGVALAGAGLSYLRSPDALLTGLLCALVVFAAMDGLRRLYRRVRGKPGLGFGDVKLLAALSLWIGADTPWIIVAAAILGLLTMALRQSATDRLAFGPYIALAAWPIGVLIEAHLWPTMA